MSDVIEFSQFARNPHQSRGRKPLALLALAATLALGGCGDSAADAAANAISVVGSSTVYPFARKVAEDFLAANEGMGAPKIVSTGSSDGIATFCAGAGADTPDIVNSSRRMTPAEFESCTSNGVTEIIEVTVGLDGIVFASSTNGGVDIPLTRVNVYRAIAAMPYGSAQTTQTWADVDPTLPAEPIVVYGPPASSGTRDALLDLVVQPACTQNGAMAALESSNPETFRMYCHALRSDSAFNSQGEQDDLIVRKVATNPEAIGVLGFSYLGSNSDILKPLALDGVLPTRETITDGTYPASRPLFIYVKKANIGVTPGLDKYLDQWVKSWSAGGPLERIGLVPLPADRQAKSASAVQNKTVLAAADLAG
jgi:phosphate transport system substrate-binding protein